MTRSHIAMRYGSLLSVAVLTAACTNEVDEPIGRTTEALSATNPPDRASLAMHWAPVHYQDVDQTGSHALGGAADYITRYDFDGDLNDKNNWDNAGNARLPLAAHAYYSVVET